MRKILLALGTVATVTAPIAAVVSCGSQSNNKKETNTNPIDTHTNEHETDNNANGDNANKNVDSKHEETKIEFVALGTDRTKVAKQLFAKITSDPKSGLDAFNGQTISDVEMYGSLVRGTLTSPAVVSRITFNVKTGELIKVETKVNDEFKDNSLSFLMKFTDANEDYVEKVITDNFKIIIEQEIEKTVISEINKVNKANDEASQNASIAAINKIIGDFVASEGFGLAFDQNHENKVIKFVNTGSTYGGASGTYWDSGNFGDAVQGGEVYITYADKSISNGNQTLAWDTLSKFINRKDREDNLFEKELDDVITAAFDKVVIK